MLRVLHFLVYCKALPRAVRAPLKQVMYMRLYGASWSMSLKVVKWGMSLRKWNDISKDSNNTWLAP